MNLDGRERVVRIRRKLKRSRYCHGKGIYKHEQLELTIPAKFKDLAEPFLNRDLKVDVRREGNRLVIEAKLAERPGENV